MIIDISDASFKQMLNDDRLFLPIRWNGADFSSTLSSLFDYYIKKIEMLSKGTYNHNYIKVNTTNIKKLCGSLNKVMTHYFQSV